MARGPAPQRSPPPPPKPKKYINFGGFKKMNTKVIRQALSEDQLAWLENMMIVGDNNIQSVPAALAPIVTIPGETVLKSFWANFSAIDYIIIFTVAGAGWAVPLSTNVPILFAPDGTFTNPDITVYGSERILIIDPAATPTGPGYCTWDGTLFVRAGGISPNINVTNGGQYSSTPLVTITGGSGTGATAHAVMGGVGINQYVAGIVLDTPGTGYLTTDTIVVNITAGTVDATATARVWPQVSGNTITTFAGRVWWGSAPAFPANANFRQLNFTGTAGYDDTDPANAAGSTTITDQDLAHNITCLRGLNNYLYIIGDNALKQIGSITVSNSITLFTVLTIASDIGTTFIQTVLSFNRYVVFANKNGVYGIFGASVQKISDDLDGIFELVDFSLPMSASLNDIHFGITAGGSIHCYLLLIKYDDPYLGPRTILCGFDGKSWFVVSQGNNLTCITSLPSGVDFQWETYACLPSGTGFAVQQLLQDDTKAVNVKLQTSLTPHQSPQLAKQPLHIGVAMNFGVAAQQAIAVMLDTENGTVARSFTNPGSASGFFLVHSDSEGYGHYMGFTLVCNAVRFTVSALIIEYVDADMWGDTFPSPTSIILVSESGEILVGGGGIPLGPP
jgi:hypothetical protein